MEFDVYTVRVRSMPRRRFGMFVNVPRRCRMIFQQPGSLLSLHIGENSLDPTVDGKLLINMMQMCLHGID